MLRNLTRLVTQDIVAPLTRRLGTAVAAYLVGFGAAHDAAATVAAGVTVAAGLAVDLVLSRLDRGR